MATETGAKVGARRVYTTKGGYVGVGPPLMEKDDIVCLIYRTNVPFILRRLKNGYALVGESYMHGMMHGEGLGKGAEEEATLY